MHLYLLCMDSVTIATRYGIYIYAVCFYVGKGNNISNNANLCVK